VEAATWRGKLVFFRVTGPWTRPERMRPFEDAPGRKLGQIIEVTLSLLVLSGAAWLARRQYKRGKGDVQGASRLATFILLAQVALWFCYSHFVPDLEFLNLLSTASGTFLLTAALSWVLYMALEPFVRKLWPQTIISWSRIVSGRVRDPLVGRDVLYGVVLGLTWVLILEIRLAIGVERFGLAPQLLWTDYLLGVRRTLGACLAQLPSGTQGTLFFFTILVVLRYLLRNRWAAAVGFIAIFTMLNSLFSPHPWIAAASGILIYGIAAFALVRFGLVTLAVAVFVADTMLNVPVTFDFSRWYAANAMMVPVLMLAIAAWGFWTGLAGQKLIKDEIA
jgi:hypothetical protein